MSSGGWRAFADVHFTQATGLICLPWERNLLLHSRRGGELQKGSGERLKCWGIILITGSGVGLELKEARVCDAVRDVYALM